MKTLEDVVDILYLHRQGLSQRQIAKRLGMSRHTVRRYIEHREQGLSRKPRKRKSKLDKYVATVQAWIDQDPEYKATWIYDNLQKQGFEGSYDIVKRKVRSLKTEHSRIAYRRFETEPGHQAQVDFGEFQLVHNDGTVRKYYMFTMVLGYSRKLYAELVERCDLPTFLDCHIRAFMFFGGIPREILYDRMRNVYVSHRSGKSTFTRVMTGFAVHYCFKPEVAPAYSPWVKGKIERPYSYIRESFWRGYGFTYLARANKDLMEWLLRKEHRIHGSTHERITDRFEREKPHLYPLPAIPFDTSYRAFRKVHKDCTVQFEGNRYVVSHLHVGKGVVVRFKDDIVRIFVDDRLHVTYQAARGKGNLVQYEKFYRALKNDRD